MSNRHDAYRLMNSQSVAVGSSAAASSAPVGAQTRFVRVVTDSGSTSPIWYHTENTAVSSVNGALLVPAWIEVVKINPGERVYARTNSVSAILYLTELTD